MKALRCDAEIARIRREPRCGESSRAQARRSRGSHATNCRTLPLSPRVTRPRVSGARSPGSARPRAAWSDRARARVARLAPRDPASPTSRSCSRRRRRAWPPGSRRSQIPDRTDSGHRRRAPCRDRRRWCCAARLPLPRPRTRRLRWRRGAARTASATGRRTPNGTTIYRMRSRAWGVVFVVACGRIGFDGTGDGATTEDGAPGSTPAVPLALPGGPGRAALSA